MKNGIFRRVCAASALALAAPATMAQTEPDNGSGTIDLPPRHHSYFGETEILDGLQPDSILIRTEWGNHFNITTLGSPAAGTQQDFQSVLGMEMFGQGAYAGYHRMLSITVVCRTISNPRTPNTTPQSFGETLRIMQGQIMGDPDFDLLRITAGNDFGLPSPGHTTLTRVNGGNWQVDSFFDIFFRIDFVGAPGGPFAGRSGSTTGISRFTLVPEPSSLAALGFAGVGLLLRRRKKS